MRRTSITSPVIFFVALVLLQDVDVLAGRSLHGSCPGVHDLGGVGISAGGSS
jgi:hypothetical protein